MCTERRDARANVFACLLSIIHRVGPWCEQYELYTDAEFLVFTVEQYEKYEITRSKFSTVFYALASIFMASS